MSEFFDERHSSARRTPTAGEMKRILRAVAMIILAAFVEEEAVKPSKKASAKKGKKMGAVKAKRTTRSSKKPPLGLQRLAARSPQHVLGQRGPSGGQLHKSGDRDAARGPRTSDRDG